MKLAQKIAISYFRIKLNLLAVISKRKAAENAFNLFCTPLRKSKAASPTIFDSGEALQFKLETFLIQGYRWPREGAKKILIVHGFESSSRNFDRYISSFIKKGYEVLAFDAPAHGLSSGKRINLLIYLAMVKQVYELYGPIDGFLAHSYGGLIVAHFLESIAHDGTTKAVFIAPATETTSTINSFFAFLRLNGQVRKEFDKLVFNLGGFWPQHYSIRRALHHIKAKVLWFHDEEDELTPVEDALKVKMDGHPNVQFRITKGLGHRKIYRDNNVMKEVIEFL